MSLRTGHYWYSVAGVDGYSWRPALVYRCPTTGHGRVSPNGGTSMWLDQFGPVLTGPIPTPDDPRWKVLVGEPTETEATLRLQLEQARAECAEWKARAQG